MLDLEVSFVNHACREAANELAISASRGSVVHRSVSEANGSELREIPLVPDPAAPSSSAEHFCNVLRGVEELGPTAEQGLAVLEIVEAVYRSSESGRAIDFEEGRAR